MYLQYPQLGTISSGLGLPGGVLLQTVKSRYLCSTGTDSHQDRTQRIGRNRLGNILCLFSVPEC